MGHDTRKELGTRRAFLKRSLVAGASLAATGTRARGAPFQRVVGANDDIRLAIVGVGSNVKIGGKGKQDMRAFLKIPGVRVAALCDVDRAILDPEVQACRDRHEPVDAYTDVRKLLDDKNIDAVSVTTPNHWHALVAVWACQAGKDVHVQKPASHNIWEGRKMVEAARKYDRIVQASTGPRSRTGIGEAFACIREGKLGKILFAHGLNYKPRTSIGKVSGPQPIPETLDYDLWSGPAPVEPLMREYLHYDWHWDWHYGNGDLGNMGIHYLDACRWALGHDTLPEHVVSVGGRFGYDDDGQTPNTQIVFFDYRPAPIIFEVRGLPKSRQYRQKPWDKAAAETMDSYLGAQIGVVIHCENGYVVNNKAFALDGTPIEQFAPTNKDVLTNFIEAMRSRRREDLSSDILQGHLSASLVHLANISHQIGRQTPTEQIGETIRGNKELSDAYQRMQTHLDANEIDLEKKPLVLGASLTVDPAGERFVGEFSDRANQLVSRPYRKPFVVPEEV